MSETQQTNDHLVLIAGKSATGKSASLRDLKNQERVLYLNCEAGKRLPFKNKFRSAVVTDPYQVFETFDFARGNSDVDGLIVDSLTFLLDMYESAYIVNAANGQKAWGDFAQFFKNLMQQKVAASDKFCIFTGHTLTTLNEKEMAMETSVPVKGSLKNNGIEAYFSTVVATKKVTLKELSKYKNSMLTITPEEEMLGYKHVFQTRLTKDTVGERIRSPMGMFSEQETYMDNNAQLLIDHLVEYYN
jgi:hypothetical protein